MSNRIQIAGWGAVSPAGWNSKAFADAVLEQRELSHSLVARDPSAPPIPCRRVPAPDAPPAWLRQPRLRRSSAIARFAVSAALEALHSGMASSQSIPSLGIIFAVQNGSVNYSSRFFAEVLTNPSLASPILFPETVFNAPSSHISSLLATPLQNYTLVSDSGGFLNAIELATQWLDSGNVSNCLIISAEEYDWLSAESLALFPGPKIATEGGAALLLKKIDSPHPSDICLEQVTNAVTITNNQPRLVAIQQMRRELAAPDSSTLISAASGNPTWDYPHIETFANWVGPRLTIQPQFGHGFSVLGGWQCVLACELLQRGHCHDCVVAADTGSFQSQATWFTRISS